MRIYTVSELTRNVQDVLQGEFPLVWVKGEVSNLARPASGHIYFALKDAGAVLNVVWFKSNQFLYQNGSEEKINPLTGEVEEQGASAELQEGMSVQCAGRITVYPPRGSYQLSAELVQSVGVGELYLRFEALKNKLTTLGFFDQAAKMVLPAMPRKVVLVTSPRGAAVRDFLRIAATRGLDKEIRIYPCLVQGAEAPAQIAACIEKAGTDNWAQVVAVIRGGGSIEDLWVFNTEEVASAIHKSRLPVLSGVGHEVDTTIADLTADSRAATPTHAAQILWPQREMLVQQMDELEYRFLNLASRFFENRADLLIGFENRLTRQSPVSRLDEAFNRLSDLTGRASRAVQRRLDLTPDSINRLQAALVQQMKIKFASLQSELNILETALQGLNPLQPLQRGFALIRNRQGKIVRSVNAMQPEELLDVEMNDGRLTASVIEIRGKEEN